MRIVLRHPYIRPKDIDLLHARIGRETAALQCRISQTNLEAVCTLGVTAVGAGRIYVPYRTRSATILLRRHFRPNYRFDHLIQDTAICQELSQLRVIL